MLMRTLPAIAALLLTTTLTVAQQPSATDLETLRTSIKNEMSDSHTPGAAMVVVQNGKVVFIEGFGRTSIEQEVPVTAKTVFRLGSTTKMLTATALLQLVADGKLTLDKPIAKLLLLDDSFARVTPKQLLSHSAGLCEASPKVDSKDDDALQREIAGWKGQQRFYTDPGAMFSYAGPSYYAAGRLIEILSAKSYPDAMSQLVFSPFAMASSTLRPLEALTRPLAQGHTLEKESAQVVRPMPENVAMYPGGSVFSTADDLGCFMIAMLPGGSARPAVRDQFFVTRIPLPSRAGEAEKSFYGFGTVAYNIGNVQIFEHGGVRKGYGSFIRFIPAKRTGIAVLANMNGVNLRRSLALATTLFTGLNEDLSDPSRPEKPEPAETRAVAGTYRQCDFVWKFAPRGDRLVQTFEGAETELKRVGPNYYISGEGQEVLFLRDAPGRSYMHQDLVSARKE
jgi:CubicO group peptidase (beta-lactamase class C family)